jgi:NTP pyrophosphatase (non-canonical NTP hydrolase)
VIDLEIPTSETVGRWLESTYGPERNLLLQGLKLASEAGELVGAIGKRGDGRPAPPEGWGTHIRREAADVLIALLAIAYTEGFDLNVAAADKWRRVQAKYAKDPDG